MIWATFDLVLMQSPHSYKVDQDFLMSVIYLIFYTCIRCFKPIIFSLVWVFLPVILISHQLLWSCHFFLICLDWLIFHILLFIRHWNTFSDQIAVYWSYNQTYLFRFSLTNQRFYAWSKIQPPSHSLVKTSLFGENGPYIQRSFTRGL